jgi:hypothetical protein
MSLEIPNPLIRVLTPVNESEVEQPIPENPVYGSQDDAVPVESPCEACGCRWIIGPGVVVPDGTAYCAFCRMWRGNIYRDAKLTEFADSDLQNSEGDDTIQFSWVRDGPGYSWEDIFRLAHESVLIDPTTDYFNELCDELLCRCPYMVHRYMESKAEKCW